MYREITHITKPHPHDPKERIQEVGQMVGSTVIYRCTLDDAITQDQRGDTKFYVTRGGQTVFVDVVQGGLLQRPYMRTRPDYTGVNNLLSLPQLPLAYAVATNALAQALYGFRGLGQ